MQSKKPNLFTRVFPSLEASATLIGTVVGAGVLAIPYAISQTGFLVGFIVMIFIFGISLLRMLMLAEITLRTKQTHQVPGYIGVYLGEKWKKVSFWSFVLSGYGSLLAYIIGQGEVLSALFGGPQMFWGLGFFVVMSVLIFGGLSLIKKSEIIMTSAIFFVMALIAYFSWDKVTFFHLAVLEPSKWIIPYGVLLFAFSGSIAIPEMREELKGKEGELKPAIVYGLCFIFIIYALFTVLVLGVTGKLVTDVATISLGMVIGPIMSVIGNGLAFLAIGTSFLTIGYGLIGTYRYDYKISHSKAWVLTVTVPLLLFLLGARNFISVLALIGGILIGVQTLAIVLAYWRARREGNRSPEFVLGGLPIVGTGIVIVSIVGAVLTLLGVVAF